MFDCRQYQAISRSVTCVSVCLCQRKNGSPVVSGTGTAVFVGSLARSVATKREGLGQVVVVSRVVSWVHFRGFLGGGHED